jgi:hypothetical protein
LQERLAARDGYPALRTPLAVIASNVVGSIWSTAMTPIEVRKVEPARTSGLRHRR